MSDDFWNRPAQLLRRSGGMAVSPDPPIWVDSGVVAEGTLAAMVHEFAVLPRSHQPVYAIVVEAGHYMKADEIRALARRADFSPAPGPHRPPIVRPANEGSICIEVLLDNKPAHLANRRAVVVSEAAVARHLGFTVDELGNHNFERFVRANIDLIFRRAIAVHNARNTNHFSTIYDPKRPGLPDMLHVKEGELQARQCYWPERPEPVPSFVTPALRRRLRRRSG